MLVFKHSYYNFRMRRHGRKLLKRHPHLGNLYSEIGFDLKLRYGLAFNIKEIIRKEHSC